MKSLKSVICGALDENCDGLKYQVSVSKYGSAYLVQITVPENMLDEVDEMFLYNELEMSEYADADVNIDVVAEDEAEDKFNYSYYTSGDADELTDEDKGKTQEELVAEEDDLTIFDPSEEFAEVSDEEAEGEVEDEYDDPEYEGVRTAYGVSWEDLKGFDEEYGDEGR